MVTRGLVISVAAFVALGTGAGHAEAQVTGSTYESSDFGSPSGGGGYDYGGGSTDYGGGYDYGGSGYDSGDSGSGSGSHEHRPLRFTDCIACGGALSLFGFMFWLSRQARRKGPSHGARVWNEMDVTALSLGIDWRARRALQAKLDALAKSGRTGTAAGRAELLRETVRALREARMSWLYARVVNHQPTSAPVAEGVFRRLGTDARARFTVELVREADGERTTRDAPALRVRPDEGEGVVVVTLIVAARRELLDVADPTHAESIEALLAQLDAAAVPEGLAGLAVIWSPAAEDDRMSTAELEQHYPELRLIDERSMAGRVFCSFCRGPFARELPACPHCGAPVDGARRARPAG